MADLASLVLGQIGTLILAAPLLGIAYVLLQTVYNVFLHPLRRTPGPLLNRLSSIPKLRALMGGRLPFYVEELHIKYGNVVRLAPNELAIRDPRAARDIYIRKSGAAMGTVESERRYELENDWDFYNVTGADEQSVISSKRPEHDRVRKLLAPAFSERAMKVQEDAFGRYVDLLVQRLRERCVSSDESKQPSNGNGAVDMRDWLTYATFDVIGFMAFGSDFGCLENATYHPWVRLINGAVRAMCIPHVLNAFGVFHIFMGILKLTGIGMEANNLHMELSSARTSQRLEMSRTGEKKDPSRMSRDDILRQNDFLEGLIASGMGFNQLKENASLLIIAGSETTATLLTGAVFLLTTHPECLARLRDEVRGQFHDEKEITLTSVNGLQYMLAVLDEAMRCYPPVAISSPRVSRPGSTWKTEDYTEIAGVMVPPKTTVGVFQWPLYHDPALFADSYSFDPERWLVHRNNNGAGAGAGISEEKKAKYANDRLDAVNPFSLGPRNCIGQTLAYAEMRLILARLVWNFDMEIEDRSRGWLEGQKNYLLWEKKELWVKLREVGR